MREAQTMTFSDAYMVIGCCFVLAAVMVTLMLKAARPLGRPRTAIERRKPREISMTVVRA